MIKLRDLVPKVMSRRAVKIILHEVKEIGRSKDRVIYKGQKYSATVDESQRFINIKSAEGRASQIPVTSLKGYELINPLGYTRLKIW